MTTVNGDSRLARRLEVNVRLPDGVAALSEWSEGGLLLETLVGRFVLDRDARSVWRLLDGHRTVAVIAEVIASDEDAPIKDVEREVLTLCRRLVELALVEDLAPVPVVA